MPRVIGFTGTIASGKTARCHHLLSYAQNLQRQRIGMSLLDKKEAVANAQSTSVDRELKVGVKYINADLVGHTIYVPGTPCYREIADRFGPQVLSKSAVDESSGLPFIDRRVLGSIVFADKKQLETLNGICWPHISSAIQNKIDIFLRSSRETESQKDLLLIIEAALLVEMAATVSKCSDVWITYCSEEVAVPRVMSRDSLSLEEAQRRVASQDNLSKKLENLKRIQFKGGLETLDTSNVSLEDGLKKVEVVFDKFWNGHFEPLIR